MSWFKKLIGRQETHEQWLEKHPGKGAPSAPPPLNSPEDDAAVRSHMEEELAEQRRRREEA